MVFSSTASMAASGRMMYESSVRGMKCSSTSKYLVNFSQQTLQHNTSHQQVDLLLVAVTLWQSALNAAGPREAF